MRKLLQIYTLGFGVYSGKKTRDLTTVERSGKYAFMYKNQ